MPAKRKERAGRFRIDADRKRCIIGHELLCYAMRKLSEDLGTADEWGADPAEYTVRTGAHEKPYYTDVPVFFNISHSGERVMVALSPCEVGCDVEVKSRNALSIAKRFFTEKEYEMLSSIGDEEAAGHEFTRLWTLKESVLKCCGDGIGRAMNDFSLVDDMGSRNSIVRLAGSEEIYHIKEYESENGYCYSVCSIYDRFEDSIRRPDL